jgi:hypothetical protein
MRAVLFVADCAAESPCVPVSPSVPTMRTSVAAERVDDTALNAADNAVFELQGRLPVLGEVGFRVGLTALRRNNRVVAE